MNYRQLIEALVNNAIVKHDFDLPDVDVDVLHNYLALQHRCGSVEYAIVWFRDINYVKVYYKDGMVLRAKNGDDTVDELMISSILGLSSAAAITPKKIILVLCKNPKCSREHE
jgi:hypothetical protein